MQLIPGDVYWAWLPDAAGRRPVIIISREELNRGDYCLAIPLTTARLQERKSQPNCVHFRAGECGLPKDCVAQAEVITFINVSDLDVEKGLAGKLPDERYREIVRAIGHVLSSDCEPL